MKEKSFGRFVGIAREHPIGLGGVQVRFTFPNGYGASVVKTPFSYGGPAGLWELAVLDKDGWLSYSTPVTDDVIGWLTDNDVEDKLAQIEALP